MRTSCVNHMKICLAILPIDTPRKVEMCCIREKYILLKIGHFYLVHWAIHCVNVLLVTNILHFEHAWLLIDLQYTANIENTNLMYVYLL